MSDFFSALSSIPGLIADFSGSTSNPYQKQEQQQGANSAAAAAAIGNPSNPLYQQLYGQYQQQNKNNLASTISQLQGQNRMLTGMGRTPLFDPNRGGETIFRGLMQGQQDAGVQSAQQTNQALQAQQQGANSAGNYYGAINSQAARAGTAQLQGYQGIANILGQITGQNNNNRNNPSGVSQNNINGSQSPYDPRNQTVNPQLPYGVQPATSNYNPNPYGQYSSGWAGN